MIRVGDSGPGIAETERDAVTKRFYRSDKSRCTQGLGLGPNLVAAVVNLHGFRFTIGGARVARWEIVCPRAKLTNKRATELICNPPTLRLNPPSDLDLPVAKIVFISGAGRHRALHASRVAGQVSCAASSL